MCAACQKSYLLLRKKGYSRARIEGFFWHYTPFPVDGHATLAVTRAFLRVKRKHRKGWLAQRDRDFDLMLRGIRAEQEATEAVEVMGRELP